MTYKKQLLIGVGLALILSVTGCGQAAQTGQSTQSGQTVQTTQTTESDKSKVMKRPDLMGQVKSIVGNSVTLDLAKVPTRDASNTEGASGNMAGGPPPEGGPPANGGAPSNASTGSQSTKTRNTTLTLTGESKELIIPVGVTITSGMGNSEKTIDLADIKVGSVLRIYYAEGTTDIERVSVR